MIALLDTYQVGDGDEINERILNTNLKHQCYVRLFS